MTQTNFYGFLRKNEFDVGISHGVELGPHSLLLDHLGYGIHHISPMWEPHGHPQPVTLPFICPQKPH